jgi:hypothetical protein
LGLNLKIAAVHLFVHSTSPTPPVLFMSRCSRVNDDERGDPTPRQFCQIAVNARYICYGLRAGQIRVLHKDTAMRALLRGHSQQVWPVRYYLPRQCMLMARREI